jgi:protein tyrosine phosphatase (PTP) superfamily phosphohydrolase (DUF442 family)
MSYASDGTIPMHAPLARLCISTLPLALAAMAYGQTPDTGDAIGVNYVAATQRLHTAGQPTAATLATLSEQGFELVVNLAPPQNQGAVPDEGKLVAEDGPTYVNIPVSWQQPTYEDFELFSAIMNGARDRKVLVHCQLNMRASAFTFLYRVVHEGVQPEEAMQALRAVWIPRDQWATFTADVLARHNVDFELPAP